MKLFKAKQRYASIWTKSDRPLASSLACAVAVSAMLPAASIQAQGFDALEEVVVTARKREETLQEVPVAVSVLTENSMANNRIEGISDLGTVVPGLVTGNVSASTAGSIYLRGVGTGAGNPTFDQAVAINIDGVGISSAQLMNAGMFDLQQIEVMRGPQALFYGKNSPGGVIAVHTKDPGEEFEAQISAHYETETEETAFRGIVSGPLTDTLGGRLSFGWTENDNNGIKVENDDLFSPFDPSVQIGFDTEDYPVSNENLFVMGTLVWDPADNVSVNFKYAHLEDEQEGMTTFLSQRICAQATPQLALSSPAAYSNCGVDGVSQTAGSLNPAFVAVDPHFPNHTGDGFNKNDTDFAALNVTVDLSDELTLTAVTGYFENETQRLSDGAYEPVALVLGNSAISTLEQWSQEIRLSSSFEGSVNFTAGLFYEEKEISDSNAIVAFIDPTDPTNPNAGIPAALFGTAVAVPAGTHLVDTDATAFSVFGQVNWEMSDQWTLAAGVRYSYEEKEGTIGVADITPDPFFITLVDDNPDWENVSPEVTLSYQYNDDIMFFGSYKTAFKSGGIDGAYLGAELLAVAATAGSLDATYNEENIAGIEVGMKSTLLDGTLRFNVTAYSFEYEDMQLSNLEQGASGLPTLTTFNAGTASLEGVEIEAIWLTPVDGLTLTANVAISDNVFDEFLGNCTAGQSFAQGCNVDLDGDGVGDKVDKAGEALPNSSDLSANFAVDYMMPVGDNWNLSLGLSTSYKSEYNPSPESLPDHLWQDSYWWTNASVSVYSTDDTWEFYARAVNLGDEYFTTNMANVTTADRSQTGVVTTDNNLQDFFGFVDGGRQLTLGFTYRM